MYSFSYDAGQNLLTVVQQGYWSMDEFRAYERDYLAHHQQIRKQHRNYRVLADCRDYPIQGADVGVAFATLFDRLMSENRGYVVILTLSALSKIQAKRAIPYANVQVFSDIDQAKEWLFVEGSLAG